MIILVGGEKGGTGKTTLATNLAAMRAHAGRDTLLLDSDPQGSASAWSQARADSPQLARVACIQKFGKTLQQEVRDLSNRYQDIIIDAGGRDSVELRAALVVAEQAIIPVQASQLDLWTLEQMHRLVETAQGFHPNLQARVLISRAPTHPSIHDAKSAGELINEFTAFGRCATTIHDRISYRRATAEGKSVCEYQPSDAKARHEIQSLYFEIFAEEVAQ